MTELLPDRIDGWLELTWALASLRRFEDAEQAARTAIRLAPNHAAALSNLAGVLLEQGRFKEARLAAEKAFTVDPDDPITNRILAAAKRPWWKRLTR